MDMASHRKTSSSGYRYSREKDKNFEFDYKDISRASTPTSQFSSRSEGRKKEKEHKYSLDDYQRKIARLRSELELEKARNKKAHKEKSAEFKEMRESYEIRKLEEINELEHKMKKKLEKERKQMEENIRNSVMEEKDMEVQNVLKYKEDEMKELKKKYKQEKDSAVKLAVEKEKQVLSERELQFQEEMEMLKKEKQKLEEEYKKQCYEESKKEKEFAKVKEQYDTELRRILGESKKVALGNIEKLKKAEKALSEQYGESDDEITDFNEILSDLHQIQSSASSHVASRSVSTTSELKFEELNVHINNLLASPSLTPAPLSQFEGEVATQNIENTPALLIKSIQNDVKARSSSAMSEPDRDVSNRKQDERDRQLQKKVTELQTQTQRLERKIALIKTENETLKRKQDDKKPLEEKIKTLKKRNAELAAIARRLEEKAKHLQQENIKRAKEITGQMQMSGTPQSTETMKKMFARQRAKDLAEHAKQMLAKDREIEELRKKCQELADELSNADFKGPENSEMYEEKEELVSIIKQAAKERLLIERQLAVAKPLPLHESKVVSTEKFKELEEINETLKKEIIRLERAQIDTERLSIELTQKKLECERLTTEIEERKSKSKVLESELAETLANNTELTEQISELQQKCSDFDQVNEECSALRIGLSETQHECEVAKGEVSILQLKVQHLEAVVQNLEFSTEKLKEVEKSYHDIVLKLQDKEKEIDHLQKLQESVQEKYQTAIQLLTEKNQSLESCCQQQVLKQQELTYEISELHSQAAKKTLNCCNTEIQTGRSLEFTPSLTSSPNQSPHHSPVGAGHSLTSPALTAPLSSSKSLVATKSLVNHQQTPSFVKNTNSATKEVIAPCQATPPLQPHQHVNGLNEHTDSTKSGGTDTGFADDDEVTQSNSHSPYPDKTAFEDPELYEIAIKLKELEAQSDSSDDNKGEDSGMESRNQRAEREISEMSAADSLSALAKKGPIQVYIAKYSYDPYKYSPNENPEAELPLQSGDYVLIYGEMDEDGFFEGELIDGRRGLVPSNFIEKVLDEDLPEFRNAIAKAGHKNDENTVLVSDIQPVEFNSDEELDKEHHLLTENVLHQREITPKLTKGVHSDQADAEELNEHGIIAKGQDIIVTGVPYPKNLKVGRQLTNCIVVTWEAPDNAGSANIRSYHVFVDGDFKTAIQGNERTKAILENVETRKIHQISVRCISNLGQSHDNQCTILVGPDVIPAPFDLRLSDITANSATISWTPGNSCLHHAIFVNNVEVRVVKPGVFSHTLTGLSPAMPYTVKIQAKNLTGQSVDHKKSEHLVSTVEFMTAIGGIPDPPVDVQVESGPQDGSILLTWLPVTIDTSAFSNGSLVAGYVVYADGHKVKLVPGATNDHCILSYSDFKETIPKELHVRTITKEKVESVDSEMVRLSQKLIKEITISTAKSITNEIARKVLKSPLHGVNNPDNDHWESGFQEISQGYEQKPDLGDPDIYYDSSCSELSDILEVEEISSPETANENNPLKDTLHSLVNGLNILSNDSSDFEEIYQCNLTKEARIEASLQNSPKSILPKKALGKEEQQQISSPVTDRVSPKSVPYIEVTREGKIDATSSKDKIKVDHELVKRDSIERIKSPKLTSQQIIATNTSKYSASKDKRDGYRDTTLGMINTCSPQQLLDNSSLVDLKSDIKMSISPKLQEHDFQPACASPATRNIADAACAVVSPRNSKSASTSASNSPYTKDLQEDSRSQSSLRDTLGEHPSRQSTSSSVPSPTSKLNSKSQGQFHGAVLSLSSVQKDPTDNDSQDSDNDSITAEINPPVDDSRVRLFVALFDYDPETMSPNVDCLDEELPFREGQIIKVFGDKDTDGFYHGESLGRVGYVPCNMVSEIQVDDPVLEEQLMREFMESGTANSSAASTQLSASEKYLKPISTAETLPSDINTATSEHLTVRKMVAMFDYDPQELSPNVDAEVELSFKAGDIIICYGEMDDDGFYMGEMNGQRGLVPSNFLQESGGSDEEVLDSISIVTPARSGESINTSDSRKSEKSENNDNKHQQQQPNSSPTMGSSPTKLSKTQLDEVEIGNHDSGMSKPRSLTPDELKQKKKSGGFFSKGKNILKKFTR